MENLPKDVLFSIAIELDLYDLLIFCKSHRNINDKVCKNRDIWAKKLMNEYPLMNINNVKNVKDLYLWLNEKIGIINNSKKFKKGEYKIFKYEDIYYIPTAINRQIDLKNGKVINPSSLFQVGEPLQFPNVSPDFFGYRELKDSLSLMREPKIKYSFMVISEKSLYEIFKNLDGEKSFVTGPFNEIYPVIFRSTSQDKNYKNQLNEKIKKDRKMIGRFYNGSILIYFGIW